jgi:hypothetical protein
MPRKKSGNFDQQKYIREYQSQFVKCKKAVFNTQNPDDVKMMEWIDSQPEGASSYMKRLVKADMESRLTTGS